MQDPAAFLAALHAAWVLHSNQNLLLKNVFLYLDTTYVRDTPGAKTIWCVAGSKDGNLT